MINLKEKLYKLGLKDKEIDVYFSILIIGKGTITDISKKTGIKRTSVYNYLENLLKENLIYQTIVKKRISYVAENPKKIIKLLEKKQNEIEKKKQEIKEIIPDLESLYLKSFTKPNINFYEGKEGIKIIYNEMVSKHKNIYSFFSPEKFFKIFSFQDNDFLLKKLGGNGGILYNLVEKSNEATKFLKKESRYNFVKNKILSENFKFNTDLLIGNGEIALISFDNLMAVLIKDVAITELQKNIFNFIWGSLK